jgi:putative ABC transport system ATP-binding protein
MSYTLLIWISNGLYSITDIQLFYKIYKESVFMIIEARELSKIYGSGESRVVALDKADLKIGQGDFLSITGPSGSGKSTLLHLLSGLDRPTSGLLSYGGRDIYSFHDKELSAFRRRRIGFIFQQFNLLPVLTARENIIMPLLLDKKQPDEAYLRKLTELLGIQKRLNHLPHELSGGQQQRVAIARALAAQPDIIFADEPTGNLDSKSGGEVMELLCNIRRELDKTLVVITHDSRIAKMADRQFVIVDGILSETGSGVEV